MRHLLSFLDLRPAGFLPSKGGAVATAPAEPQALAHPGLVELSPEDLPAVCPNAGMPLWSSHPRVFLEVVNEREAMCPYCGTRYRLRPGAHVHDHGCGSPNMHQHRDSPGVPRPGGPSPSHPAMAEKGQSMS
jgi:uncharacterized Zn-finger protein